jgi:hypothetical protein
MTHSKILSQWARVSREIEYKIDFHWTFEIEYDITQRMYKTCFSAFRLIDVDHRDPKVLTDTVLLEDLNAEHAEIMSDEEVAYFILEQILTFENHEAREWFKWKGAPNLSPHHMDPENAELAGHIADFEMRDPTK